LTECDAQARGCARRIIEVVIIKDHVHFVRFLGELLTPFGHFRDFVFANPVRLWTALNPDFFKGTAVEGSVAKLLAA